MKTGAKLPPQPSVCRLCLCRCLGVGVNVGVVVVGDTCERYVRCIQQAAAAVAAASACVFLPISKNIWMIFFSCFFFGFFDRISSYLAEVKQNNNKTRALFCTHTNKQGSTQTVRWGRGSVHYGKRCFLNILYISHYSPYNCKWRWLLLYCVCVTVTVGNYLCLVFCFQLFICYLRNGTRVRQGEEKCNNHMKQSQTFALEEHALSRLHHIQSRGITNTRVRLSHSLSLSVHFSGK